MDIFHPYTSTPAQFEPLSAEKQQQCSVQLPKDDDENLRRQACMFTAAGEMVCDDSRRNGQHMIVRQACARPPVGYSQ